ncbi:hypothetical protein GXM_02732 [Nostoc sphaeroides CCNUC1]|uniref:Uncharacterized protein n=1 Tax=Nostoc sphaeroides CCNUC1 TaxID=2653204 RepID=A0A5P8VXW8_9NOSO|nr:hypothetical protein GXM_02732 [Nostoc sphaeroides CCNUC1]
MLGFVPQPNLHWSYFLGLTEQYWVQQPPRSFLNQWSKRQWRVQS